jgi:acyl-CoA reductase-like NAD-dependent aldehyde dehydrogenase
VLNIVHGTHDTVNRILDHPDIAAISFVGSGALAGASAAEPARCERPMAYFHVCFFAQ